MALTSKNARPGPDVRADTRYGEGVRQIAAGLAVAVVLGACTAPTSGAETMPPEAHVGSWPTWVLASPSQIAVPPPPAAGSPAARAEAAELRRLTARRTPEQERQVAFWSADPAAKPWMDLALQFVAQRVKNPPLASRNYALVSVAMYDATVAAWHWKDVYRRPAPSGVSALVSPGAGPSYPSEHAVIAGAASRVLQYAFPEQSAARLERMAEEAATSRVVAGVSSRSDVAAGLALGRAVADAVIARGRADGSDRPWDERTQPHGPGLWEPPPGSVARPVEPLAGTWATWVLASGSQLRPEPPPAFGSPEYAAEVREVMEIAAALDTEQQRIAKFWEGGEGTALPPGIWNQVLPDYTRQAGLGFAAATRAFSLVNVALADAGVASWDAKYTYWTTRPENAVRELGLAPDWKPYLDTPFFPSYVSGHAVYSGAVGEVLAYLFPAQAEQVRARAEEAAMSRLYGGIHFRSDSDVGLRMGRQIGTLVVRWAEGDEPSQ